MNRLIPHLLLVLIAGLLGLLALMWVTPSGEVRNVRWSPPPAQKTDYASMVSALPKDVVVSTAQFVAMLERPLFTLTRRPPPPPESAAKEAPPPDNLSTAKLLGVMAAGADGKAIVDVAGKVRRIGVRESLEGWTLSRVDDRSVTFASGGQTRVLALVKSRGTTYTGQSPAATAATPTPVASPSPSTAQMPSRPSGSAAPRPSFGGGARPAP